MNGLDKLLKPSSIAVIGASNSPHRAGKIVMKNLLEGGFSGAILPVNPKHKSVRGVLSYPSIDALPIIPDLAILCTHASRNVELFKQLASKGIGAVIVLSSDMYQKTDQDETIEQACLEIATQHNIRVLGPNSLGVILPWAGINASFSPVTASRGKLAFISQSAAVCTTVLDWANDKNIGFSSFISLGNAGDIDVPELLDTLCTDSKTEAILLYIDSIKDARAFISAARAASRNRRILVLKGGRTLEGQEAAILHTGGLPSLDVVYDAAIRRSGMLRVSNTHELFAAVETLTHAVPLRGERLAIVTNGGGPAVMAVDTLIQRGGKLAKLSDELISKLNQHLPESWSKSNPIDLIGDADNSRYIKTIETLLDSDEFDALLIMHSPSAIAKSTKTAQAIIDCIQKHPRKRHFNILTNWSGEQTTREARLLFTEAGIPTYRTAESAVIAFMHLVEYRRNQRQLMETPVSTGQIDAQGLEQSRYWIKKQLSEKRVSLDTHQLAPLLEAYGFEVLPTWICSDPTEAVHIAEKIGYPVAVKLRSPDIAHKSEVHGVMLNLRTSTEVANAAQAIKDRVALAYPAALIEGLLVQGMAQRSGGQEIRVKVHTDPIFGPVIMLGEGSIEWDLAKDAAVAIPPLNTALARYLVVRAVKSGKLRLQQGPNPVDIPALCDFLVRISQMVIDCPEIIELDIHPALASGSQFTILDADLKLAPHQGHQHQRLAIRPYPVEFEQHITLKDGSDILLRPILPEDEPKHADFIHQVSKEDLYKRFFSDVGEFNHEDLANFTQIDYNREMAFVATKVDQGKEVIIGVARALADPQNIDAEFAILVRSDLKGIGLGKVLMEKIISYCKVRGTKQMSGMTMPSNRGMLTLAQRMGFEIDVQFEDGVADMRLPLNE
ncbi:bifunctional acetate--CoA ligase family protein/GNAT family N-acetyltransferase [Vibrio sp. SCSIO 43136]|uniref:bifunctional acetate--CoA ligase family protein/GNAT family N-acetyltransferase n=1 Tax=Vibrio sp. SCSIO 43136 TaxID=2819101 RepID=UPI0020752F8C|nr:bifunctional acetate--CoA ligase family protein/GNAT family N-acetyltransferase [Vibrio sp. SCSIO 43136]USD68223.1 bifunctional acetate--CoA ligase family protein/GNAT family N-acetyltransferase [Vibrio sp. SCSIO 43136]